MSTSHKKDFDALASAYISIFENDSPLTLCSSCNTESKCRGAGKCLGGKDTVEEETDEEGEDETMAAAVSVQQTAADVENRGEAPSQKLRKAEQESERYIDKKINSFKKQ